MLKKNYLFTYTLKFNMEIGYLDQMTVKIRIIENLN